MAVSYLRLFDPTQQFQLKNGALNVSGRLYVYLEGTDDYADLFDENGAQLSQPVVLDNNGRAAGLYVDSKKTYWMKVNDQYDTTLFTIRKMTPCGGGGGSVLSGNYDVVSTDGSIIVDKSVDSGNTTFDLSIAPDATDLLEWFRSDASSKLPDSNIYKPASTNGTMNVGEVGVQLNADQYYHVTAHVTATKNAERMPFYDEIVVKYFVRGALLDSDQLIMRSNQVVDYSLGMSQEFEVSTDVLAPCDCELYVTIEGQSVNDGSFALSNMEIHRIFSGAPTIPSGVLSRDQADAIYQPILTAGTNITIDEHNVISAAGTTYTAGNGIDITSDVISVDTSVVATQTDLEGKQDVLTAGDNITIDNNVISATAAPQEQADWTESDTESVSYIKHKPTELPAAIDNGVELIAGQNITLTNTLAGLVISASGGGGGGSTAPWTYSEDTAFYITVTASDAFSSYFERLVPITNQTIVNSGKDFAMFYQCIVEADSANPPSIPDMTPIKVNVYNYPNHNIDEMTGIFTTIGGAALQSFASHGSVVLGSQMLDDGRLFSVFFPLNTLTEGDKFKLIVRAIYIELTGVSN